jgi:hypothetical protein
VRVSSLGANKPDGRFVEWGWVLGYDGVTAAYHSRPFLFYCYKTALTRQCRGVGEKDDSDLTFRVDDADQDFIWEFYLYSYYQNVGSVQMDFRMGTLYTNAERDCACDSAWAHFRDLKKWHRWSDSGFQPWGALELIFGTDPAFRCREVSVTDHYVERRSNNTC